MGQGEGQGEGKGEGRGTGSGKDGSHAYIFIFIGVVILIVLIILAIIGLNITKIVMGAVYLDDCPLERLIPIYLIVSGSISFFMAGLQQVIPKNEEDREKPMKERINVGSIIGTIGLLFNFAWLICGSVWIFGNYQEGIDGCGGSNDCCHEKLIKFAFAVTIVDWVIYALVLIAIPIVVCCIVCGLIKKNKV